MSRSLIAIIKGGLGNQLFGYAAARTLARREQRQLFLDDSSGFLRDGYGRSFRLDRFPIAARPAPPGLSPGDPKCPRHRWLRTLDKLLPPPWKCYLKESPGHGPAQLAAFHSRRRVVHLAGYWQDEACFDQAAEILRRELQPPPSGRDGLEGELRAGDSVFLHVRRIRYSPRLAASYYQDSISAAREMLPSPRFEVFGDDPVWARDHLDFGRSPVRFHDPAGDELIDFRLMTRCRHAIVANSSFSWWAAWLQDPGHHVWFPENPGWPLRPATGWILVPSTLEA